MKLNLILIIAIAVLLGISALFITKYNNERTRRIETEASLSVAQQEINKQIEYINKLNKVNKELQDKYNKVSLPDSVCGNTQVDEETLKALRGL